jgi:hypothetical protein
MGGASPAWKPTEILRFVKSFDTGAGTVLVETDAGPGYLKPMGNHSGEHVLACEWLGTQLAKWLGLPTFEFCLIEVTEADEIPLYRGGDAVPGPAFITRSEKGGSWGGSKRQLKQLVNPQDMTRLLIFDTWTRNCDRYSPDGKRVNRDNVFLSRDAPDGKLRLKAMDHTHCFTCGSDLTKKIGQIGNVKDNNVFGRFPEFREFLDRDSAKAALKRLSQIHEPEVVAMTQTIPSQWDVSNAARDALVRFVVGRAAYLVDTMEKRLWPQNTLNFPQDEERPR